MQFVLYEPGLGYYSAGTQKLGRGGDFTTAPEISDLFGISIADYLITALDGLKSPSILEIGAGSGQLALNILSQLETEEFELEQYYILELSADLIERQKKLLSQLPALAAKVTWLDSLPENLITGAIIGNEVIDAIPFQRFKITGKDIYELGVLSELNQLYEQEQQASETLTESVRSIEQKLGYHLPNQYQSEIRLNYADWFASVSAALFQGIMIFVDYGFSRSEYYSPSRSDGTLVCHYQNIAHYEPLLFPGLQDISAWVDFSLVADNALDQGCEVFGYTSQMEFLLSSGILGGIDTKHLQDEEYNINQSLKQLLLPSQMGEAFKCMLLSKNYNLGIDNLEAKDYRYML
jgi:SAM-dependent MidA family methyltransferase